MDEIKEWYYNSDADVAYGTLPNKFLPKLILLVSSISIVVISIICIILRSYLYDLFNNPQIQLTYIQYDNKIGYYVTVPYKYDFVADKFIDPATPKYDKFIDTQNNDYTYSISGQVNTQTIGDYKIRYISKNKIFEQTLDITVKVRDISAPIIKLNDDINDIGEYEPITLVRGTDDTNNFNADDYIQEVIDNYDSSNDIYIEHNGDNINFGTSGTTNTSVIYTAVDLSGNIGQATLPIIVIDEFDSVKAEHDEKIIKMNNELYELLKPLHSKKSPNL